MNYETVVKNIEVSGTATISHINEVIDDLMSSNDYEEAESWEYLYTLIHLMGKATKYNGSSNDYHNLAVTLARADQYDLACDVLEIGLQFFDQSMDLLADFLVYAIHCNKIAEGQVYYDKLMNMDKAQWNWRAFDFSIEYLKALNNTISDKEQQRENNECIDSLVLLYQQYHKKDEKSYFAEYAVADSRNKQDEAIERLKKAVADNNLNAPRCTLKIAEEMFEIGEYEEAEKYIKQCKTFITTTNFPVELGNVYTLSALCGMCLLYKKGMDNCEDKKQRIDAIYKDCAAAGVIYHRHRFPGYKELEMQRDILERLSDISYVE